MVENIVREKLKGIIEENLAVKWLENEEARRVWREIENDKDTIVPVDYGYYSVKYQNQYFCEVYKEYIDLSFVIYTDDMVKPVGIFPLCACRPSASEWKIGAWMAGNLMGPLIPEVCLNRKSRWRVFVKLLNALKAVCEYLGIKEMAFNEMGSGKGNSEWFQMLLRLGGKCEWGGCYSFVDLDLDLDVILRKIRRNYRKAILKGEKFWYCEIVDKENSTSDLIDDYYKKFEDMHFEVAGRVTRSSKTWNIQCDALKNTNDFVVIIRDRLNNRIVGMTAYTTTGTFCTGACGVYYRDLFDKPVSHISKWAAIRHMKEIGLRWYCVGQVPYPQETPKPTDKEVSIGYFKEGLSTHLFNRLKVSLQTQQLKPEEI